MSAPTTYNNTDRDATSRLPGETTNSSTIDPGITYTHKTVDDELATHFATESAKDRVFTKETADAYVAEARKRWGSKVDEGTVTVIEPTTGAATDPDRYRGIREREGDDVGRS